MARKSGSKHLSNSGYVSAWSDQLSSFRPRSKPAPRCRRGKETRLPRRTPSQPHPNSGRSGSYRCSAAARTVRAAVWELHRSGSGRSQQEPPAPRIASFTASKWAEELSSRRISAGRSPRASSSMPKSRGLSRSSRSCKKCSSTSFSLVPR